MARLEYLDDFYGLGNEKRINMRHTLSTLTLRTILALQGLCILRNPRKQRRCPSPRRLHGDFVAGVSNLIFFRNTSRGFNMLPVARGSESPSGGQPAAQTCGFPLPVTSHGGNSRKAIFKTGRVRSISTLFSGVILQELVH